MLRKIGLLAVILALALLASSAAQAMPLAGSARASESGGVVARVWDWIASLFRVDSSPSEGELGATWEGDGTHIDPHG